MVMVGAGENKETYICVFQIEFHVIKKLINLWSDTSSRSQFLAVPGELSLTLTLKC